MDHCCAADGGSSGTRQQQQQQQHPPSCKAKDLTSYSAGDIAVEPLQLEYYAYEQNLINGRISGIKNRDSIVYKRHPPTDKGGLQH